MLEVRDLWVRHGAIVAVAGTSLRVDAGEIVALIGSNGAGKSSLLGAVAGVVPTAAGEVLYDGIRINRLPAHEIVRRGIALVPEGRLIFATLTVRENLMTGALGRGGGSAARSQLAEVVGLFPWLARRLDAPAAGLSGGERQTLALARGLMARPRLLLLDEPSLGLSPRPMREAFALIAAQRARGLAVLLVEQNVRQSLAIADRGYVLQAGKIVLDGRAGDLLRHDLLADAYLGIERKERSA